VRENPLLLCFVQFHDKFINQTGYEKKSCSVVSCFLANQTHLYIDMLKDKY